MHWRRQAQHYIYRYPPVFITLFSPLSQETCSLGKDEESCPTSSLTLGFRHLAIGSQILHLGILASWPPKISHLGILASWPLATISLGSLLLATGNWLLAQRIRFWLLGNWLLALALSSWLLVHWQKTLGSQLLLAPKLLEILNQFLLLSFYFYYIVFRIFFVFF